MPVQELGQSLGIRWGRGAAHWSVFSCRSTQVQGLDRGRAALITRPSAASSQSAAPGILARKSSERRR